MQFKLKKFKMDIEVTAVANIHYFEFTKQFHTYSDKHPFRELIYVDNGEITVNAENFKGTLCTNEMIVHKTNELHSLSCDAEDAPNVIIIGFACDSPKIDVFSRKRSYLTANQQRLLTEIIKEGWSVFLPPYDVPYLYDMKKRSKYPFGASQMIKMKLEMFFIDLIRSAETVNVGEIKPSGQETHNEIYSYLTENYMKKIKLDELCFIYNTNKTSLCNNFKREYGCSIIEYVRVLRIKEAKKLMREGNYNITQIASATGFSSLHYFTRIFKKYEKKSPSDYIKMIKAKLEIQN